MKFYTIGYAGKSAREFFTILKNSDVKKIIDVLFTILKNSDVKKIIDVRLYPSTKDCGFARSKDLEFFLWVLCRIKYEHHKEFSPTPAMLKGYKDNLFGWNDIKEQYLNKVFEEQKIRLVYNDAHFDNFLYDGENVFIIDFDRVLCTSIDYELMIIGLMLEDPAKFASYENEKFVKKYDYINIWLDLQNFYPEMFNFTYIHERLYIYSFIYKLGQAFETNNNEKIKELLFNFEIFVDDLSIHM